jgi:hypothetical protein
MAEELKYPLTLTIDLLGVLADRKAFPETFALDFSTEGLKVFQQWGKIGTPQQISEQVEARYMDIFMRELSKPENGILNQDVINALIKFKAEAHKRKRGVNLLVVTRLPEAVVPNFYQRYPDLKEVIDGYVGNDGHSPARNFEPVLRILRERGTMPYLIISNDPTEIVTFQKENVHRLIYYGGNDTPEEMKRDFALIEKMKQSFRDKFCRIAAVSKVSGVGNLEEVMYGMFF